MLGKFKIVLPENVVTVPAEIVLGIRPENVRIAQPQDSQTVQGRVYLVENLGMHNLVSVQIDDSQAQPLTLRALLATDQKWSGEDISLVLPPQNIHWFDVQTGDAVFMQQTVGATK